MERLPAQPFIRTSVNMSPEFHKLCREHRIKFSDAMRAGVSLLLAEKGAMEYNNNLNISRQLQKAQDALIKMSERMIELDEKKNQ